MAGAALHLAGIGLHVADGLDRHAQPVGRDLGEGGLVPLAVGLRADRHHDLAIGLEAHLGALVGGAARRLEETGNADAQQSPARLGCGTSCGKSLGVGARHGGIEIVDEAARVDGHAERCPVGKGGNQILPPELGGIAAELARGRLDGRAR